MPAPEGVCRLCDQTAALAESHILPEFFYDGTYDDSGRFISVSSHPHHRPRPMQRGIVERLLCVRCETKLSRFETYGAGILRRIDEESDTPASAASRGVVLRDVDLPMFRLFALSLLWRMHESRNHMFGAVNLRARAASLKAMIVAEDPGLPHEFGLAIAKVTGLDTHGSMIIAPIERRMRNCRAYVLMARGFDWVFIGSSNSATLRGYMPFVGERAEMHIPFIEQDRDTLFGLIRRAFPDDMGRR